MLCQKKKNNFDFANLFPLDNANELSLLSLNRNTLKSLHGYMSYS